MKITDSVALTQLVPIIRYPIKVITNIHERFMEFINSTSHWTDACITSIVAPSVV